MALTISQIKTVQDLLSKTYGKKYVEYDNKKIITVFVDNADRTFRKNELQKIQKMFSKSPFFAKYTIPTSGGKTGAVKMAPIEIQVKASLEAKPISTGRAKFKPSDINPSIVNVWLSPEEIVKNVELYIKKLDLQSSVELKIINLLKLTVKDTNNSIPFDVEKDLVPAEFFEILTSVKLSVLLRANDIKIRKILGIPKRMDLSKSKIKIYIPQQANFPLIDYYISVTASEKKEEDASLKISVKSKVKSPKANTVKFKDIFEKEQSVEDWYKSLNYQLQKEQKGPKIVADSAIKVYKNFQGKSLSGIPIFSVLNLLKEDKKNIENLIKNKFQIDVDLLKRALEQVSKKIKTVSTSTDLSEVIDDKNDLSQIIITLNNVISKTGGKKVDSSVYNLAYLCERILVTSSKQNSETKYNYYQMFFDEVLTKKRIAYAVSSVSGKNLNYNFYSLVNFSQEYASWLELRSKNSPNSPNDVIGIDV